MISPPLRWPALLLALLLASCANDAAPEVQVPSWAKVAPEQIAEAKKHGVPVAFENDLGMRFVLIPAGTFLMGSPEDEKFPWFNTPPHTVTIREPFYMSICEVTNGEYRRKESDHASGTFGRHRRHSVNGDLQPVAMVSWEDASRFAMWVSRNDAARKYVLSSEAQWERACRAGTTTRYWWGEDEGEAYLCENARTPKTRSEFGWRDEGFPSEDGHLVASPVGSYRPNAWGLYDMLGNVQEWCQDQYSKEYADHAVTNPSGPSVDDPTYRVIRGGAWGLSQGEVQAAYRDGQSQTFWGHGLGFRLVSPLPEKEQ